MLITTISRPIEAQCWSASVNAICCAHGAPPAEGDAAADAE
jgi:hypothetical protein